MFSRLSKAFLQLAVLAALSACREEILHELDEAAANRAQILLDERGITAGKSRDANGWKIDVDTGQASDALRLLEHKRFLKRREPDAEAKRTGLIPTAGEKERLAQLRLEQELAATLEKLPRVLEARVHLHIEHLETPSLAPRDGGRDSATVLLVEETGSTSEPDKIKRIIEGASGIRQESVRVVQVTNDDEKKQAQMTEARGGVFLAQMAGGGFAALGLFSTMTIAYRKKRRRKDFKLRPLVNAENEENSSAAVKRG